MTLMNRFSFLILKLHDCPLESALMELQTSFPETDLKGQGTLELILTQVSDNETRSVKINNFKKNCMIRHGFFSPKCFVSGAPAAKIWLQKLSIIF